MSGLLTGRRILVVEDEMLVLMNIELALGELGCTAICAVATVEKALLAVREQRFDAAMLDVNLGGEKSYPIADALLLRGTPFAFSTGYGDLDGRPDLAGWPLLRKPYVLSALAAVFEQLMAGRPLLEA